MLRYSVSPGNGVKDNETGMVWMRFDTPKQAQAMVTSFNNVHIARSSHCSLEECTFCRKCWELGTYPYEEVK